MITGVDIRDDWKEVFTEMGLSKADIQKLIKVYSTFPKVDSIDTVKIGKMMVLLEIDNTRFNEKVFATFDKENARCIDFYAFVVSLWKFCCLQRVAISKLNISNLFNALTAY